LLKTIAVQPARGAVDPAETESLFDRLFVTNPDGMLFGYRQPDPIRTGMVLPQPGAPPGAVGELMER
jgi:hypothetical protein